MRHFWQPVHRSKDLHLAHTQPIRILGADFTLYRGEEGTPHVVAFRCAHRGTQLSAGWVEGDCLRCVYHGWKYDGSGWCLEQPAEEKPFTQKIRIRSCPTKEYLGLIFAYFGEGEPPPLPRYPHFEIEGILDTLPTLLWPCNFFQRLENAGDAAHSALYPPGQLFLGGRPERDPYRDFPGGNILGTGDARHVSGGAPPQFTISVCLISMTSASLHPIGDPGDDRIAWTVPVDDDRCIMFRVRLLPITGDTASRYLERQQSAPATDGPSAAELGRSGFSGQDSVFRILGVQRKALSRTVNA